MGHNISAVHGVKSPDFYNPGNAVNEIWIDDFELISRLPFGDSDLGQASWPPHDWPKIPWHQFIIPLKRDISTFNATMSANMAAECAKPRIFGIGSEWSSTLYFVSATMIAMGFLCFIILGVTFSDINATVVVRGNEFPLRYTPEYLQPRNVLKYVRGRLIPVCSWIVSGTILFAFGFPMAMSTAHCVNGFEVFRMTISIFAFLLLEFVIGCLFYLGRTLRRALKRREGDELDRSAYARHPELLVLYQSPTTQPSEHATDEVVDVEKTAGSGSSSTQV